MKNAKFSAAMALAVMSSAMSFGGYGVMRDIMRMPRIRSRKRCPEQSQRQALCRFRRAQGGPGLTEGEYPGPRAVDERYPSDAYHDEYHSSFFTGVGD